MDKQNNKDSLSKETGEKSKVPHGLPEGTPHNFDHGNSITNSINKNFGMVLNSEENRLPIFSTLRNKHPKNVTYAEHSARNRNDIAELYENIADNPQSSFTNFEMMPQKYNEIAAPISFPHTVTDLEYKYNPFQDININSNNILHNEPNFDMTEQEYNISPYFVQTEGLPVERFVLPQRYENTFGRSDPPQRVEQNYRYEIDQQRQEMFPQPHFIGNADTVLPQNIHMQQTTVVDAPFDTYQRNYDSEFPPLGRYKQTVGNGLNMSRGHNTNQQRWPQRFQTNPQNYERMPRSYIQCPPASSNAGAATNIARDCQPFRLRYRQPRMPSNNNVAITTYQVYPPQQQQYSYTAPLRPSCPPTQAAYTWTQYSQDNPNHFTLYQVPDSQVQQQYSQNNCPNNYYNYYYNTALIANANNQFQQLLYNQISMQQQLYNYYGNAMQGSNIFSQEQQQLLLQQIQMYDTFIFNQFFILTSMKH